MTSTGFEAECQRPSLNLKKSHLQQICSLNVDSSHRTYRMTNIICTIGPACDTVEILSDLIENGMSICRFNFSHGDHDYHARALHNLKDAIAKTQARVHSQVATAVDISGPGIRIGRFKEGLTTPVFLTKGHETLFTCDKTLVNLCDKEKVYVQKEFINQAQIGDQLYIEDGPLCFDVKDKDETILKCVVAQEGEMGNRNQCHIPKTLPSAQPQLSEKDKKDLEFCVRHNVDMVFVSWVWCPEIIMAVREQLGEASTRIKVVAKIENYQGVKSVDQILEVADGIMVARGDLGIDIPPEKVFLAQKMMIGRANLAGKPVICAAQMLDSMVTNPRPTRAEASDVANAILDGADCVMLSKETAIGKHPGKVVSVLAQICREAENAIYHARMFKELRQATAIPTDNVHGTSIAAVAAAMRCSAAAIVVVTNSGRSATLIARYRPHCIILAVTKSHHTARCLNLYRGIFAILHTGASCDEWYTDIDMRIHYALEFAQHRGYVKPGDVAVLVTGYQSGPGSTNTVRSILVPYPEQKPHYLSIPNTREHLDVKPEPVPDVK